MIENEFAKAKDIDGCGFDPTRQFWGQPDRLLQCLSNLEDGVKVTASDIQNMIDRYDGEISYADEQIGTLIAHLRRLGALKDATIVVMADHGEAFLEHNRLRHGREVYQTQVHVPLIIWKGDGSLKPNRIEAPTELIDVMPTLFPLIGLSAPRNVSGLNLLQTKASDPHRPSFSMTWNSRGILSDRHLMVHSIQQDQWKYIRTTDAKSSETVREEIYNLADDIAEHRNMQATRPDILKRLRESLSSWLAETDTEAPAEVSAPLSEAQKERLRALGYTR